MVDDKYVEIYSKVSTELTKLIHEGGVCPACGSRMREEQDVVSSIVIEGEEFELDESVCSTCADQVKLRIIGGIYG